MEVTHQLWEHFVGDNGLSQVVAVVGQTAQRQSCCLLDAASTHRYIRGFSDRLKTPRGSTHWAMACFRTASQDYSGGPHTLERCPAAVASAAASLQPAAELQCSADTQPFQQLDQHILQAFEHWLEATSCGCRTFRHPGLVAHTQALPAGRQDSHESAP